MPTFLLSTAMSLIHTAAAGLKFYPGHVVVTSENHTSANLKSSHCGPGFFDFSDVGIFLPPFVE